jgi:hypothetical protein
MGSLPPNSERLLGVILTDGRHCKCRDEDDCPHAGSEWCHNLAGKGDAPRPRQLPYLDATRCLYGDTPDCCWVLADVEKLASDYLAGAGVPGPPVPSELIDVFDQSRRVEVRLVPLKALHGVVWLMSRGWIIQLNSRDSRRVRRYSLFHEAFHIACRITCPACDKVEVRRTSFNEVLADHFAACVLMPKEWVEEHWPRVRDVRAMAGMFDVPLSQMRQRIKQLNLPTIDSRV